MLDITNWTVNIGQPSTDTNNKVNVSVTYAYNDGTNKYSFTDNYSGVLSNDNLVQLIQLNLTAHDETVQGLLNVPNIVIGQVDLTQLFPVAAAPVVPALALVANTATAQSAQPA